MCVCVYVGVCVCLSLARGEPVLHGQKRRIRNPHILPSPIQLSHNRGQNRRGDSGLQRREEADEGEDAEDCPEARSALELRRIIILVVVGWGVFGIGGGGGGVLLRHGGWLLG